MHMCTQCMSTGRVSLAGKDSDFFFFSFLFIFAIHQQHLRPKVWTASPEQQLLDVLRVINRHTRGFLTPLQYDY